MVCFYLFGLYIDMHRPSRKESPVILTAIAMMMVMVWGLLQGPNALAGRGRRGNQIQPEKNRKEESERERGGAPDRPVHEIKDLYIDILFFICP